MWNRWVVGFEKEGVSGERYKIGRPVGVLLCSTLKFLDTEPKKCKPSPSCPLAHPGMAFIWFGRVWVCAAWSVNSTSVACNLFSRHTRAWGALLSSNNTGKHNVTAMCLLASDSSQANLPCMLNKLKQSHNPEGIRTSLSLCLSWIVMFFYNLTFFEKSWNQWLQQYFETRTPCAKASYENENHMFGHILYIKVCFKEKMSAFLCFSWTSYQSLTYKQQTKPATITGQKFPGALECISSSFNKEHFRLRKLKQ